jgi:hypothetical protein
MSTNFRIWEWRGVTVAGNIGVLGMINNGKDIGIKLEIPRKVLSSIDMPLLCPVRFTLERVLLRKSHCHMLMIQVEFCHRNGVVLISNSCTHRCSIGTFQ